MVTPVPLKLTIDDRVYDVLCRVHGRPAVVTVTWKNDSISTQRGQAPVIIVARRLLCTLLARQSRRRHAGSKSDDGVTGNAVSPDIARSAVAQRTPLGQDHDEQRRDRGTTRQSGDSPSRSGTDRQPAPATPRNEEPPPAAASDTSPPAASDTAEDTRHALSSCYRLPKESVRDFRAFCFYRDLGPERSLQKAWRAYCLCQIRVRGNSHTDPQHDSAVTKVPGAWTALSTKYQWVKRADAYDQQRYRAWNVARTALEDLSESRRELDRDSLDGG